MCVDLKGLNENVLRETHPTPGVDTLAQLTGATVFSKVDANSKFWQIPLLEDSRLLTTFITPYGRGGIVSISYPLRFQVPLNRFRAG